MVDPKVRIDVALKGRKDNREMCPRRGHSERNPNQGHSKRGGPVLALLSEPEFGNNVVLNDACMSG
jgi:hypothetical protein